MLGAGLLQLAMTRLGRLKVRYRKLLNCFCSVGLVNQASLPGRYSVDFWQPKVALSPNPCCRFCMAPILSTNKFIHQMSREELYADCSDIFWARMGAKSRKEALEKARPAAGQEAETEEVMRSICMGAGA